MERSDAVADFFDGGLVEDDGATIMGSSRKNRIGSPPLRDQVCESAGTCERTFSGGRLPDRRGGFTDVGVGSVLAADFSGGVPPAAGRCAPVFRPSVCLCSIRSGRFRSRGAGRQVEAAAVDVEGLARGASCSSPSIRCASRVDLGPTGCPTPVRPAWPFPEGEVGRGSLAVGRCRPLALHHSTVRLVSLPYSGILRHVEDTRRRPTT